MSETLKERTWRERQEADAAVADALDKFGITETAYNEARLAYNKSLKDQDTVPDRRTTSTTHDTAPTGPEAPRFRIFDALTCYDGQSLGHQSAHHPKPQVTARSASKHRRRHSYPRPRMNMKPGMHMHCINHDA
jgi:hypothetical protein